MFFYVFNESFVSFSPISHAHLTYFQRGHERVALLTTLSPLAAADPRKLNKVRFGEKDDSGPEGAVVGQWVQRNLTEGLQLSRARVLGLRERTQAHDEDKQDRHGKAKEGEEGQHGQVYWRKEGLSMLASSVHRVAPSIEQERQHQQEQQQE